MKPLRRIDVCATTTELSATRYSDFPVPISKVGGSQPSPTASITSAVGKLSRRQSSSGERPSLIPLRPERGRGIVDGERRNLIHLHSFQGARFVRRIAALFRRRRPRRCAASPSEQASRSHSSEPPRQVIAGRGPQPDSSRAGAIVGPLMARGAVSLVSVAAIVAVGAVCLPTVARASEGITSFKTTLAETGTPLGNVSASGIVEAAPSGESFPMEASTGSTDTVELSLPLHRLQPRPPRARRNLESEPRRRRRRRLRWDLRHHHRHHSQRHRCRHLDPSGRRPPRSPDLFVLESPGSPEAAKNIIFNAPTGVFGNPRALSQCLGSEFALDECSSDAQAGLITVYAKFSGEESQNAASNTAKPRPTAIPPRVPPHPPSQARPKSAPKPPASQQGRLCHYRLRTTIALGTDRFRFGSHDHPYQRCRHLKRPGGTCLLGTAPVYDLVPEPDETAGFAFVVPTLDIPITIPVTVRTNEDFGLRFTVSYITQLTPLATAKLTFWGFPAEETHHAQRFHKGAPGEPAGCSGLAQH